MEVFIGIDPGQKGGFALVRSDGTFLTHVWDDLEFVSFAQYAAIYAKVAYVEKVSAMPKQGVTSMFNFGKSAGFIEGVLATCGIPYQLVPPQKWKKEFSLGSDKGQSIVVCERLFPTANLYRTPKCSTKHDGMAEALLLAEYARRSESRA